MPILWDYVSGLKKGSEYDNPKDRFYINEGIILYDNKKNIDAAQKMKFHTIRFRNIEQVKSDFTQLLKCGDCCSVTAKSSLAKPKTYSRN